MTVSGVLVVNLVWSVLMLCAFTALAVGGPNAARWALLLMGVGNLAIAILALRRNRWAIAGSIMVAALVAARWTPMVLYNWWAFFTGHQLYRDSPGTIIVVAIYSVLFAAPAMGMLVGFWANRRVLNMLLFRTTSIPVP